MWLVSYGTGHSQEAPIGTIRNTRSSRDELTISSWLEEKQQQFPHHRGKFDLTTRPSNGTPTVWYSVAAFSFHLGASIGHTMVSDNKTEVVGLCPISPMPLLLRHVCSSTCQNQRRLKPFWSDVQESSASPRTARIGSKMDRTSNRGTMDTHRLVSLAYPIGLKGSHCRVLS